MPIQKPVSTPGNATPENGEVTVSAVPMLNLSALVAEDAPVEATKRPRKSMDFGPFPAWLQDSYDRKVGKSVTVPEANARMIAYLIRRCAGDMKLGASVALAPPENGMVTVNFAAKDKRKHERQAFTSGGEK